MRYVLWEKGKSATRSGTRGSRSTCAAPSSASRGSTSYWGRRHNCHHSSSARRKFLRGYRPRACADITSTLVRCHDFFSTRYPSREPSRLYTKHQRRNIKTSTRSRQNRTRNAFTTAPRTMLKLWTIDTEPGCTMAVPTPTTIWQSSARKHSDNLPSIDEGGFAVSCSRYHGRVIILYYILGVEIGIIILYDIIDLKTDRNVNL
ncbi:hypothetical protein EDC01DRAFT_68804 [Geopyxis carbonaria]|nr:hypothetical protein EDC01DRAFT_68804 [Geopyxis carbonaria]